MRAVKILMTVGILSFAHTSLAKPANCETKRCDKPCAEQKKDHYDLKAHRAGYGREGLGRGQPLHPDSTFYRMQNFMGNHQ